MIKFPKHIKNDSAKAGKIAAKKHTFGDNSRYAVAPVHTRFDALEWFVWDAYLVDDVTGCPALIRQSATLESAMAGLV